MATRGRKRSARCPCFEDDKVFQKVVDLKEAGLVVYRHTSRTKFKSKKNVLQQSTANKAEDTFVLHNTKDEDINSADIMIAFDKYEISCPRCRYIIENAKKLLRTVSKINKNNVMGICDHCRRKLARASCMECDRIVKKFVSAITEAKDSVHNVKMRQSQIHRLVNDVFIDDINVSRIHRKSQISIGGPEITDVFYSKTAKTDTSLTPLLSDDSNRSHLNFPKIKRRITFIDPTESYQTANKRFYSRSHEDLTHEVDDWPELHHTAIRGSIVTKKRRNSFNYESMIPLPDHNKSTGIGESAKASFKTDQLRKSMTDFRKLSHIPSLSKYNSEESLITAISDFVDDDTLKKGFQYYFPKEAKTNFKRTLKLLSSATLIKDTHEKLHAKAKIGKMKREEDRIKSEEEKELKKISLVEKKEQKERATGIEKQERKYAEPEIEAKLQKELLIGEKHQDKQNKTKGNGLKEETKNKDQHIKDNDLKDSKEQRTNKDSLSQGKGDIKSKGDTKENKTKDQIYKPDKNGLKESNKLEKITKESKSVKNKKNIEDQQVMKDTSPETKNKLSTKSKEETKNKDQHIRDNDLKESKEQLTNKDAFSQGKSKGDTKENKTKDQISKPDRNILKEEKGANQMDKATNVSDGKKKDNQEIKEKQAKKDDLISAIEKSNELGKSDKKAATIQENKEQSTSKDEKKREDEFKKLLAEKLKQKEEDEKQKKYRDEEERKAKEAASKKNSDSPNAKSTIAKAQNKQENPATKDLSIQKIKVRNPSIDDLIIQLVKLKQSTSRRDIVKPFDDDAIQRLIVKHKGHKLEKTNDCLVCTHSDLELELEDFVHNNEISDELANIVIGEKIYKYKSPITKQYRKEEMSPIFFKTVYDEDNVTETKEAEHVHLEQLDQKPTLLSPKKGTKIAEQEVPRGIIRYALSDRTFIEKGWTLLPTEKVVRKMNVYRMRPAHPEFDWFEHNKSKQLMQYDSGEKLAEFDEKGRGRWFYKNGRVALDYYDAEETNAQQRFVVYSSGEPDERGRSRPFTILATFDYVGNGIVFDHSGKIRLKYNQTEGVVLDRAIGPVSHWKWHTLNDPPVLQQVMIDTQMPHKDPNILKLGKPDDTKTRPDNEEMLAIEFDNFIKEKSKKLSQSFKPFQIKMKALKINEQFSLKVLDQATVYLIFRDGAANLKLNLGMILDHKEIVDTDTSEVGEVSNSMERLPARTDSIAGLQKGVAHAQYVERLCVDRERRLRPTVPTASVDRLNAAATRPLKPPFRTAASCTSASTVQKACTCRKPLSSNLYYDTRLI